MIKLAQEILLKMNDKNSVLVQRAEFILYCYDVFKTGNPTVRKECFKAALTEYKILKNSYETV